MNSIKNKMLSMVNIKDIETVVKAKMLLRKDAQINIEQYLEEWATNKSHIFKLFGEKLTLEEEVELDEEEIIEEWEDDNDWEIIDRTTKE